MSAQAAARPPQPPPRIATFLAPSPTRDAGSVMTRSVRQLGQAFQLACGALLPQWRPRPDRGLRRVGEVSGRRARLAENERKRTEMEGDGSPDAKGGKGDLTVPGLQDPVQGSGGGERARAGS